MNPYILLAGSIMIGIGYGVMCFDDKYKILIDFQFKLAGCMLLAGSILFLADPQVEVFDFMQVSWTIWLIEFAVSLLIHLIIKINDVLQENAILKNNDKNYKGGMKDAEY